MIPIVKKRQRIEKVHYERAFRYRDCPGAGAAFPCDKEGNIFPLEYQAARDNLADCLAGKNNVEDLGVQHWTQVYYEPAIARCICGHEISLASFTNTCSKCGRDYNQAGQQLASRSQWGEETGETADEILSLGHTVS